jgi:NAD+ synthase
MILQERISNWIKDYCIKYDIETLVVGISGGIDSALVSTLCSMTGLNTIVVSIPIKQNLEQLNRAKNHITWIKEKFKNVKSLDIDLTNISHSFINLMGESSELSIANSKSRLRMVTLYHIACNNKGIVVGTGNKIEDFGVGFFTKYGDGGVDISPIADLTKTEVRNLSKELGIINDILVAESTDGLWDDDRTDEKQIGATYEQLEWAMDFCEKNNTIDFIEISEEQKKVLQKYLHFNEKNKHKILPIPIFKK